jgi:hypothetical protein
MGMDEADKEASIGTIDDVSVSSSDYTTAVEPGPHYNVFKQPKLWWKHNYLSWRFYVTIYAFLAFIVTLVVFIALIAGIAAHGVDRQSRILLSEGSCGKARWQSFFGHAFISGMGTYMLSASAYVMV